MTPVVLASKYNNLLCAILLVDDGANIHVVDNKMQNVLFYAITNENEKMIRYFISKDEQGMLRKEKNWNNKTPMDLEKV